MSLFTKNSLAYLGKSFASSSSEYSQKSAGAILTEEATRASADAAFDLFLSHSYLDASYVRVLKRMIVGIGVSVYVDWIEDSDLLRNQVTPGTARRLRRRMQQCTALAFATSPSSPSSKWMPWELGYFDGRKGRVAVLPVLDGDIETNAFRGQEYLGLYPYITKDFDQNGNLTLWVQEDTNTYTSLRAWLKGREPVPHPIDRTAAK